MRALLEVAYSPYSRTEIEQTLSHAVDLLAMALIGEPFSGNSVGIIGSTLVDLRFTNADSVRVTSESLGGTLMEWATEAHLPNPADRVGALIGSVAAGHAESVREWLFGEQEQIKRALFLATNRAERRLQRSEARFRQVFASSPVGFTISAPGGRILQTNMAMARIVGSEVEDLVGRNIEEFFHPEDAEELRAGYRDPLVADGRALRARYRLLRTDEQPVWVYLAVAELGGAEDERLQLTMVEDVSDLHLLQDRASNQSLHDLLTKLPNRQYLQTRLQSVLQSPGRSVALFHLDLDGFSVINDGLGPEDGDRLLTIVARRLEGMFQQDNAFIVRTGGDEFAVLLWSDDEPVNVLDTINRIYEELDVPAYLGEHGQTGVALSASIGVAHGKANEISPYELIRRADITLRRMRATGHRQWAEFDPIRDDAERKRLRLAAALPGALEFGELAVCWQPWMLLADRRTIAGMSPRVVWNHPVEGPIEHQRCLALAAETGAELPVGAWLLNESCRQVSEWRGTYGEVVPEFQIALTPTQANDPDLIKVVSDALSEAELPARALSLAVPAAALSELDGEARDSVQVLTEMGVGLVIGEADGAPEDIGLFDELGARAMEISEELIGKLRDSGRDSVIARTAVAGMRAVLNNELRVLVRGLSSDEQVTWWRDTGASWGAGPIFSPNLSAEEFAALLASM
jgi:diguanylate cyclase (GGDEF)-like protein/PAS domain S-box-containing protein